MKTFFQISLLVLASLLSFFAGFCLLGGADGAVLSRNSLLFGLPALILSGGLVGSRRLLGVQDAYTFVILLAPVTSWLLAVSTLPAEAFRVWLYGTPALSLAVCGYSLFRALR